MCCLEAGVQGKLNARLVCVLASSHVLVAGEGGEETYHIEYLN